MSLHFGFRRFGAGAAVVAAGLGVAFLVILVSASRSADARLELGQAATPSVPTLTVEYRTDASMGEYFPGLVTARRESELGFERGGRIDDIAVDVGDRVVSGQVLARLDTRALEAQIAAADAQTAEAQAQVALAQTTEDRQQTLLERGHISQQRLDEVATSTHAAEARRRAAAASANALRAQLALSVIEAPYDGVITARLSDEGGIAAPGQGLLRIVEDNALEIRVGLPPESAATLSAGEIYAFETATGEISARFRASTGVVDTRTRSVTAVFDVEGHAQAGQVARLRLEQAIDTEGFWVPTSALAEGRRGLWSVYVLEADEYGTYTIAPHAVENVRIDAGRAFVRGAVDDGAVILRSGLDRITPGQRVRIGDEA